MVDKKMKIKKQHYDYIKSKIKETVEYNGYNRVIEYYEDLKQLETVKEPKIRLMYDLKNLSIEPDYTSTVLYEYMNDKHITTALLKIGHDLKLF